MDKEPGQRTREAFEACFVGYAKMIMQPGAWDRVSSQQKAAWVQMEAAIEAPHLAEVEQLKAKVAELEAQVRPETTCVPTGAGDSDEVCSGCGHAVVDPHSWSECTRLLSAALTREMDGRLENERRTAELERERDAIVGKLGEAIELIVACIGEDAARDLATYHASMAQELPPDLPLRTLDAARIPDLNRDEHLDRPKPEQDHVHEVGSCSFCDRALRQ